MISEFFVKGATSGIQTIGKTGWDSSFAVSLPDTTAVASKSDDGGTHHSHSPNRTDPADACLGCL